MISEQDLEKRGVPDWRAFQESMLDSSISMEYRKTCYRASRSSSRWEFPKIRGTLFGGPHNKDYSILGSILRSP